MKKNILIASIFMLSFSGVLFSQNVGINTTTPDNSAILDLSSTERGLLIPRVQLNDVNTASPILAPVAEGVIIYNATGTEPHGIYYWDGSRWSMLFDQNNPDDDWSGAGTGSMYTTHTTDKVGIGTSSPAYKLDVSGTGRYTNPLTIGAYTLPATDGTNGQVLKTNGSGSVSWDDAGGDAGWALTGNAGTVDGTNFLGTTDNVPLNFRVNNNKAGRLATDNTTLGYQAGNALSTGTQNVLIGQGAGQNLSIGNYNVAIGHNALNGYMYSEVRSDNVAIGWDAMFYSHNKSGNVAIGKSALSLPAGGDIEETVAIGYHADQATSTIPTHSVALGARAEIGAENSTAIGYRALATQANSMILGSINGVNGATASTDIGIGTTEPQARLNIGGGVNPGGFAIGDGQSISSTHGHRRSIQLSTDTYYGGDNDNHSGYLVYSIMSGWDNAELHICTSHDWGTYTTGTPALRITQTATYANGTSLISDKRLKKDVQDNPYGLNAVMKMKTLKYKKQIVDSIVNGEFIFNKNITIDEVGFFAQDLYEIIPEVVHKPADESKETWAIDYSKLVPVLTKAIQELNEENNILTEKLLKLEADNNELEAKNQQNKQNIEKLQDRVEQVEELLNFTTAKSNE